MATHGTLSAFDSSTTDWCSYTDQLNYYFIANKITTDKKKVTILLSACGQATFKTISSLVDADTLKGIKYNDLIQALSEHYDPAPSSIVQRFKFYSRVTAQGRVLLTMLLPYDKLLDIVNQLVCGVNHQAIQKRLVTEKSLTVEKALEIAFSVEAADNDVK